MAGFAVDIGDAGTAFEQGVAAPSATATGAAANGLAMLGKGIFGALDDYAAAQKTTKPTEGSINREAFASLSEKVQGLKGKTPLQLRASLNGIIADHNAQGYDIGEPESNMIKMMTGIDVSYLNFDPAQEAINSTVEKMQENPAYLYTARAELVASGNTNPTQEEVLTVAMGQVQKSEAASLYLANSKNIAEAEFLKTFVPHANTMLKDTTALAFAALKIETEGGNVAPEQLIGLQANLTQLKAILSKPSNVSDESYSSIKQQVDLLEGVIEAAKTYDEDVLNAEKADVLEGITRSLMAQAQEVAKTDPALASVLLSDNAQFLSTYAAERLPEVLKTLGAMKVAPTIYTPLELPSVSTGFEAVPEGGVQAEQTTLHTPEMIEEAQEATDVQRTDNIFFATVEQIRLSTVEGMNDPAHRTNFLTGVGKATVNIATSGKLLSQTTLNEIFNEDVFAKLKVIEKLDPEAATLAREQLQDALTAQFSIASTSQSGSLKSSNFVITGVGKIEFDLDAVTLEGETRMGQEASALVTSLAKKYYNGDITALVVNENRGARNMKLTTQERSALAATGFNLRNVYMDYNKVQKEAKVLSYYTSKLKDLGVDVSVIEQLGVKAVPMNNLASSNSIAENTKEAMASFGYNLDRTFFINDEDKALGALENGLFKVGDVVMYKGPQGKPVSMEVLANKRWRIFTPSSQLVSPAGAQ